MNHRHIPTALVAAAALAVPSGAQAASYDATIAMDGPLSYHRLDEPAGSTVALDSSGHGVDGVYSSAVALGVAGPFTEAATAMSFASAGSTMTAPLGSTSGTVELWVNSPRLKRGSQAGIIAHGDPTGSGWALGIGQKRRLTFVTGGQTVRLRSNIPSGVWSNITVTWDSGKVRLYVNGAAASKDIAIPGGATPTGGTPLVLGGSAGFSGSFTGKADQVALYAQALTADRIAEHFAAAKVPVAVAPPTITGSPVAGGTLTAVAGTWTGDTSGSSWQWELCDELGDDCDPLTGATDQTYVVGGGTVGGTIRVIEQRSNASGTTAAESGQTKKVTGDSTLPGGEVDPEPVDPVGPTGPADPTGPAGPTSPTGGDGTTVVGGGSTAPGSTVTTSVTGATLGGSAADGVAVTSGAPTGLTRTCLRLTARSKLALRKLGTLRLTFPKSGCVTSVKVAFKPKRGAGVRRIALRLDGKKVAVTKKRTAVLRASRLAPGRHVLRIEVTRRSGRSRSVKLVLRATRR